MNAKRFGLYSFSFHASHSWNQIPDYIKDEASVKAFRKKLVGNWQENYLQSADFRIGNIQHNKHCLLHICYVKIITLF